MASVRVTTCLFFWFWLTHTRNVTGQNSSGTKSFFFSVLSTTVLKIFLNHIIVQRFTIGEDARPYIGLRVRRHLLLPAVNWMESWEKQPEDKYNLQFQENSFCSFRVVTCGRTAVKKRIPSMFQTHWTKDPKTNFIFRSPVLHNTLCENITYCR